MLNAQSEAIKAFEIPRGLHLSNKREYNEPSRKASLQVLDIFGERKKQVEEEIEKAKELLAAKTNEYKIVTLINRFMCVYHSYASGQRTAFIRLSTSPEEDKVVGCLLGDISCNESQTDFSIEARRIIISIIGKEAYDKFTQSCKLFVGDGNHIKARESEIVFHLEKYDKDGKKFRYDINRVFCYGNPSRIPNDAKVRVYLFDIMKQTDA